MASGIQIRVDHEQEVRSAGDTNFFFERGTQIHLFGPHSHTVVPALAVFQDAATVRGPCYVCGARHDDHACPLRCIGRRRAAACPPGFEHKQ